MLPEDDPILQRLLHAVEENDEREVRLVVNVGGALLEGRLVSHARYLRLFGDALASSYEPQSFRAAHILRETFNAGCEGLATAEYAVPNNASGDRFLRFAHLVDVTAASTVAGAWRIPVRSIDGYSIATLRAESQE